MMRCCAPGRRLPAYSQWAEPLLLPLQCPGARHVGHSGGEGSCGYVRRYPNVLCRASCTAPSCSSMLCSCRHSPSCRAPTRSSTRPAPRPFALCCCWHAYALPLDSALPHRTTQRRCCAACWVALLGPWSGIAGVSPSVPPPALPLIGLPTANGITTSARESSGTRLLTPLPTP